MNRKLQVYFDHNATTALDDAVLDVMMPYLQGDFSNPSSRHLGGMAARRAIDQAREQVANSVGVQPEQVIFCSGGSEANNLFILGAAGYLKPTRIIISAIEHPCVLRPAQELARRGYEKWDLRRLAVDHLGQVALDDVNDAMTEQRPGLVSVMLANNETGVIQDVPAIAEKARENGAWMHTDAVQALGKIPINFEALRVHAMTLSGHKIYGPKGSAALIMDKRLLLKPLIFGGGQENGLRSGTENVPAIVGLGAACELAKTRMIEMTTRIRAMHTLLEKGLISMGAVIFGQGAVRLPNTCYFAIPGIEGDTLSVRLDKVGFAVASGAACSSATPGKSHVLEAMGVDPTLARCAVRVSLGSTNTPMQIEDFLKVLDSSVTELKHTNTVVA